MGALERRIEDMRRELQDLAPESEEYSDRLTELVRLEKQRRRLGGQE